MITLRCLRFSHLVDPGDDSLLVHGLELSLLCLRFFLQSLNGPLEPLGHLLLELLGAVRVLLAHLLVLVFKVRPILHHLKIKVLNGIVNLGTLNNF